MSFILQIKAMMRKNFIMTVRVKAELFREIIVPVIAALIIYASKFFMVIMMPIYIPGAINGFTRKLLINFVHEKSEKYKETQKIMGLTQSAYVFGWLITSYLKGLIVAVIIIIAIIVANLFPTNIGFVIAAYVLYTIAAIHQTLCISTLFSKPKLAGEMGTFLQNIASLLFFVVFATNSRTPAYYYLISIFPQPACTFAIMGQNEQDSDYSFGKIFTAQEAIMMLAIDSVFYFLLYLYLDQVLPNEFGIRKSPFFCIHALFSRNSATNPRELSLSMSFQRDSINNRLLNEDKIAVENDDISSAAFHEPFLNHKGLPNTVKITNLSKKFGHLKALNKVSLNLYESNILCLLGHNGAGKTTMIHLLTGLIERSDGEAKIYGLDLKNDIDRIRTITGLCPQKDVLYDELTIEEHLEFIASIKNVADENLSQEIESTIAKVGLNNERGKIVKNLSGGNKRKLSLGMSIIGKSKLIFLDEPTSGMDPVSRRIIWDVLVNLRSDSRTLVLTTHHLEEADYLADRIAILAKGKLLALGTSDFIKKNFGVGYHLNLSPENQFEQATTHFMNNKQELIKLVTACIKSSKFNPQTTQEILSFTLPFSEQQNFSNLFKNLEEHQKSVPFQISLEMNTLEDTFVNIGLDEDKFFKRLSKGNDNEDAELEKFTDFSNIVIPPALSRPPSFSFSGQFIALFLRKYYLTVRNWAQLILFLFPMIFIVIGTVIGNNIIYNNDIPEGIKIFTVTTFLILAYSFNSSVYIGTPVQEREFRLKYALNVMGCRKLPYWIGTLAFDMIAFTIPFVLWIILLYAMSITFLTKYIGQVILIMICFGLSIIQFAYLLGLFFEKSNSAYKVFPLINYFLCYSVPWIFIGIFNDVPAIVKLVQAVAYVASPFFTVDRAFLFLSPDFGSFDGLITNSYALCLVLFLQFALYFVLTIAIEDKKFYLFENSSSNNANPNIFHQGNLSDNDVYLEEQRVNHPACINPIKLKDLKKTYSNGFYALKGVSFGVEKGQLFGLLGPNGAGKSTTFNILTALIEKSSGSVELHNIEILPGLMEIYQNVGICPQFDCLWEHLTPGEHLYLFGRMKGLSGLDLQECVDYFMKVMQLLDFTKTKAGNLSGGNKRKVCVANALIGGPDLQFFDEPSTGLDPIAKRFLWNTLTQSLVRRNSSIVLTTHSMTEAESLCHKVGILINGKLVCLGTNQHLKNKYGNGYRLSVNSLNNVDSVILGRFPKATQIPSNTVGLFIYQFPIENFSFFNVFSFMHDELKHNGVIQDFSINQCSLEQIFIYFSRFQHTSPE